MLLLGRVTQASASTYPSEIGLRLSVSPDSFEEWSGPPRLLGRPLPARPGQSPRQVCHLLAHLSLAVMALLPSEMIAPWAPGTSHIVSRPYPRGSHVRRPTHRRDSYPQRRKALLPACRAQLWPGGFRTHWTTYRISVGIATSFPFGPALPGRFYHVKCVTEPPHLHRKKSAAMCARLLAELELAAGAYSFPLIFRSRCL